MTALFSSLLVEQGASQGLGTPLDYGNDLRLFLDAENDVITSGENVTSWEDQDTGNLFTVPGGGRSPVFEAVSQNGLPGINFQQPVGESFLDRKIAAAASFVDDFWGDGSGDKSIAFAGRLNRLTDSVFGTSSVIASKGYRDAGGWELRIQPIGGSGTLRFLQRRSDGSTWQISVNGFYDVGDLVLGYLTYDGGNTSSSGEFRIYNGTNFVNAGSISTGSSSGIGQDTPQQLVIGNVRDPDNSSTNQPFEGPLFAVWMTRPAANQFDESYLTRWIP